MKYCISCLQPDTRPNILFNKEGVCPACIYFKKLKEVDWHERYEILQDLIDKYNKKKSKKIIHDCIIGVSGGKDSTRQALWIRDKLKLNPLLVCVSYPPEQVNKRGVDNLSNLIELGFDVRTIAPAPGTWKELMLLSFSKFTNWCKSTELALFSAVPRLAIQYKIPLIFWGENPGLQLGDIKTLGKTGFDGNNLRFMNTLNGGGIDWILDEGFDEKNLIPYIYPDFEEFDESKLQIIYLGWFLGDWSLINNGKYSALSGLEIRHDIPEKSGDIFGLTALDEDWVALNQMIKYYKFGFGRTTDYVNEEIRLGRITREKGIELVEKYDDCCGDEYIESFCKYLEISESFFWDKVHKSINKELFELKTNGKIIKKFKVGFGLTK